MSRENRAFCRAGLLVIGVMFEHFSYPLPLLTPTGAFLGIGGMLLVAAAFYIRPTP